MSRKRIFDSVVERAIRGGILEGGLVVQDQVEEEKKEEEKPELYRDLKKILVMRVKGKFDETVYELNRGFPLIRRLLQEIREELGSKYKEQALNLLDKIIDAFGKSVEETSDIASHLHAVYRRARKHRKEKDREHVKKVIVSYAKGFFSKLYVPKEKTLQFYAMMDRFYGEVENVREQVKRSSNGMSVQNDKKARELVRRIVENFAGEVEVAFPHDGVMREMAKNLLKIAGSTVKKSKDKRKKQRASRRLM